MSDGTRKVTAISELTGMEGDVITMQDIFVFERMGITQDGRVRGRFRATGIRPKCAERLAASGVQLPMDMFEHVTRLLGSEATCDRRSDVLSDASSIVLGAYYTFVVRSERDEQTKLLGRLATRRSPASCSSRR